MVGTNIDNVKKNVCFDVYDNVAVTNSSTYTVQTSDPVVSLTCKCVLFTSFC
jgi:hypothetical protein